MGLTSIKLSLYHGYMDPKKQDLSPELKEVYERVMNTQAKPTTGGAPAPAPTVPQAAPTPSPSMPTPPAPAPAAPTPEAAPPTPTPTTQTIEPTTPAPSTFAFSGNKMTSPQGTAAKDTAGKKKIPPFVIPIGVVVLVIAWAALWAKIFGLFG